MSMVSYAAGSRYLSLIGGVCLSFYDWYCDLPPASRRCGASRPTCRNRPTGTTPTTSSPGVPTSRRPAPRTHFFTEVRYKGTKTVAITPDYSEVAKLTDLWLNPKQGTDAALAQAFNHVIFKEFHLDKPSAYFTDYASASPTCRCW
jgi:nitrate reductase alpha subunit